MNKKPNAGQFTPYIEWMLSGKTLKPDATADRQQLARIADGIRSVCFIPVETVRLMEGGIGYRITEPERRAFIESRADQEARQRKVIEHAANRRDARRAKALFARLNIELPPEVAALARMDVKENVIDINELGEAS